MRHRILTFGFLIAASASHVAAQTQINTTPGWDHSRQIGMFGALPGNTVFGESFTAPSADNVLNSFTFWLNQGGGRPPGIEFSAYVMAWDATNTQATGSILWSSVETAGPTSPMQEYDFDVGSLTLAPGGTYIAFLSTIPYLSDFSTDAQVLMGYVFNPYAGGRFYALSNQDNLSALTAGPWDVDLAGDYDAAFIANFTSADLTSTPEPTTVSLTALGLVALAGAVGRKRRRMM